MKKKILFWDSRKFFIRPGWKLGNFKNLGNLRNFFPRFLNPSFRFCPTAKIENPEIRKLEIIYPRFPSFQFAIFSFLKKIFFQYSKVFKILPCRKKVYLLWDIYFEKLFKKLIYYIVEKETCINRSFFIYGVFIYLTWDINMRFSARF